MSKYAAFNEHAQILLAAAFLVVPWKMSRKRKVLTLEERVSVLKKVGDGKSCRSIALELGVGKTQIQSIVKEKDELMKRWESGSRADAKYSKPRTASYEDIDEVMWEWFTKARAKNIPVSGRMIQEKALMFAGEMGHLGFTASNGWLNRWQKRHNVRLATLSGEAADVSEETVEDWRKRLKSICEGYSRANIFNADETGLFYRALPTRSMVAKGDEARGGKKSKERISVLLACSCEGEKLIPFVIGNSAKPRCFRRLASLLCLPVTYSSNKKAWMTSQLFKQWLDKVNNRMIQQHRSILLFIDNCSAHPDVICSNIKLVFLPPNTTAKLQPCDAGLIQNVKMHYRKLLVRHVLSHMDDANTATELSKKINILDAIMWLKSAWDSVQPDTIKKCFAKCGFDVVEESDLDDEEEDEVEPYVISFLSEYDVTWDQFVNFDGILATNETLEDDWENTILESTHGQTSAISSDDEDEDEDDISDTRPIVSAGTAMSYLSDIQDFAIAHQSPELLDYISKSKDAVSKMICDSGSMKQTKLTDYCK